MNQQREEALLLLQQSDQLATPAEVDEAMQRLADEIQGEIGQSFPLVLSVMGSASVFTGQLLPRLPFPLQFGYVQLTAIQNGDTLDWRVAPTEPVRGRTVLVIDDLLDDGLTMAAIRQRLVELGSERVLSAVLCDKMPSPTKPCQPEFCGFTLPDRHVFGFGMDIKGYWRNLKGLRIAR